MNPYAVKVSASPLLTSLVSYWKLDEASGTRNDSHGANNLTDNNTVTSTTGKISNAAEFNSANAESLSHASNADLVCGDVDFTFTGWIYQASAANGYVIAKDDPASRDYGLRIASSVPIFEMGGGAPTISSSVTMSTSTWYFIVVWHDATANTINIQVNDGSVDSAGDGGFSTGASEFRIGSRSYPSFEAYYTGLVDEVGFWKRILTTGEKTSLYNGGSGLTHPF